MFLIGLFLFGYSSRLSHNSLFYYLCGISIGVTASLFIIILFIGRLIPKVSALFNVMFIIYVGNVLFFNFRKNLWSVSLEQVLC